MKTASLPPGPIAARLQRRRCRIASRPPLAALRFAALV